MPIQLFSKPDMWLIEVPLPNNPLKNLNCYVLHSEGQWLVVDTGFRMPECEQALLQGLAALGVRYEDTRLFLTHLHSDHTGLVAHFSGAGCPVYMHPADHQRLLAFMGDTSRFAGYEREGFPQDQLSRQEATNPAAIYAPKATFDICPVADGQQLQVGQWALRCVTTPGHTPGHTCLYVEDGGIMLLGDHLLFDITPNITVWSGVEDSLGDYLASLDKIEQLQIKTPLPAHRGVQGTAQQRIAEIKRHHAQRLENTLELVRQNPGQTAYAIAGLMKWQMRGKNWEDFPTQQKWFAVGETIAHLDHLRLRGAVQKHRQGGVFLYTAG